MVQYVNFNAHFLSLLHKWITQWTNSGNVVTKWTKLCTTEGTTEWWTTWWTILWYSLWTLIYNFMHFLLNGSLGEPFVEWYSQCEPLLMNISCLMNHLANWSNRMNHVMNQLMNCTRSFRLPFDGSLCWPFAFDEPLCEPLWNGSSTQLTQTGE